MPQNIRVKRFWTEMEMVQDREPRHNPLIPGEPKGPPEMREVHWVEYATRFNDQGQATATTVDRIRSIDPANMKFDPTQGGGEKQMMFESRWEIVGPAYEAWKEGRETPLNGTPLDLWPGLTSEHAEIFRIAGLRSVEDIRDMDQSAMARVSLPNVSDYKKRADIFLQNTDVAAAAAREAEKDRLLAEQGQTIQDMAERMAAMEEMLRAGMPQVPPVAEGTEEVEMLRAELDRRGITYHHKAGASKLRELLDGQEAA